MEGLPEKLKKPPMEATVRKGDPTKSLWKGPGGESTRRHPAPFPEELAHRLVRTFSFAGDTVLDPFLGTGTTLLASARCGRNAIGVEIEPAYARIAKERIERQLTTCFRREKGMTSPQSSAYGGTAPLPEPNAAAMITGPWLIAAVLPLTVLGP